MSAQLQKARALWTTTTPAALSALDLSADVSDFRPTQWWGRRDEIFMQEYENDLAYLAFLENAKMQKFNLTSPIAKWRVGRPADLFTTNDIDIAAADIPLAGSVGYISLVDTLIIGVGHMLDFIDYNVSLRVLGVDDDDSNGWTNAAGTACNVKVERLSGPSVAIPAHTIAQASAAPMGEQGTPSQGLTSTPGDPVFNTFQLVGLYGSITRVQTESVMVAGWGTHPKLKDDIYFQHRLRKQHALLFGQRYYGTDSQVAQGQLWLSAGIVGQVKTHVMSAGALGINLAWPKLNDFWEGTFNTELSSAQKDHFCGSAQFRDIRKTTQEYNAEVEMMGVQSGATNPNSLGANSMTIYLQSGKKVVVHELRRAFAARNLDDWGITVDASNIAYGTYNNLSERWFENIEGPAQAITVISDALIDTWMTCVKDESTCAVIRGGTRALVER